MVAKEEDFEHVSSYITMYHQQTGIFHGVWYQLTLVLRRLAPHLLAL